MKFYVSFGQNHAHRVGGFTYDRDVLCEIDAPSHLEGREAAFKAFGPKWSFFYEAEELPDLLPYFPRGIHALDPTVPR